MTEIEKPNKRAAGLEDAPCAIKKRNRSPRCGTGAHNSRKTGHYKDEEAGVKASATRTKEPVLRPATTRAKEAAADGEVPIESEEGAGEIKCAEDGCIVSRKPER